MYLYKSRFHAVSYSTMVLNNFMGTHIV